MRLKQFPDTSRSLRLRKKQTKNISGYHVPLKLLKPAIQRSEMSRAASVNAVMKSRASFPPVVPAQPSKAASLKG